MSTAVLKFRAERRAASAPARLAMGMPVDPAGIAGFAGDRLAYSPGEGRHP